MAARVSSSRGGVGGSFHPKHTSPPPSQKKGEERERKGKGRKRRERKGKRDKHKGD